MLFICGTGCWLWGINRHQLPISIFINCAHLVELLDMQHHLTIACSTDAYVHLFYNAILQKSSCVCSFFPLLDTVELIITPDISILVTWEEIGPLVAFSVVSLFSWPAWCVHLHPAGRAQQGVIGSHCLMMNRAVQHRISDDEKK